MHIFKKTLTAISATVCMLLVVPGTTQAAEAKFRLKLQDYSPPSGPRYEAIKWWMGEVQARTQGNITFQEFFGASLVPANEALSAVSTGLADVGMVNSGLYPAQLPLHTMGSLPFGAPTFESAGRAWMALYDEFPEMRAELESQGVVPLTIQGTPSMQLRLRKAIDGLADMKGRMIRTYGQSTKAVEKWGAVPVSMPFPEIYEALRLGTIDGAVDYLYTVKNYKLHEVGKYFVLGNFGAFPTQPFVINKRTWEKLGSEYQKILQETAAEAFGVLVDQFNKTDDDALSIMVSENNTVYELNAKEREEWFQAADTDAIWNEWAESLKDKAPAAKSIATRYLELANK